MKVVMNMTRILPGRLAGTLILLGAVLFAEDVARSAEPVGSHSLTSPFVDPAWKLQDLDGKEHSPWSSQKRKAVVLVFIGTNCPVSNYFQPTLGRLQSQFDSDEVAWYFIHTDPQVTRDRVATHRKEYSITAPVMLDPKHALAHAAGATKLPQAIVLTRGGQVAYRGRIDDTYVGFGKKRAQPSRQDLKLAIDDVVAGRKVAVPETESVGCFIPFADR